MLQVQQEILDRCERATNRIVNNVRLAQSRWGLWEAVNDRLSESGELQSLLKWHTPDGFSDVRSALAEAAILAILRTSENPASDRLTACTLRGVLANDNIVPLLVTDGWLSHGKPDLLPLILQCERERQPERIQWFQDNVPLGWAKGDARPLAGNLLETREWLRHIRDRMIAHSLDGAFDRPTVNQVRAALVTASEIAQKASLIFLGHTSGLDLNLHTKVRAYDDYWHWFESGLRVAYSDWKARGGVSDV